MEFDRNSNEWETKRPNMRQRLEQERTDEDKLDAAYVKHKTNPADALKSVIGSPMGYLDDDMCDRARNCASTYCFLLKPRARRWTRPRPSWVRSRRMKTWVACSCCCATPDQGPHRRACMLLKPKKL